MAERPTILVIGPTPPPYHGVSVATQTVLQSALREQFHLTHLDLSDRRGIQHVDKPDMHDVWLFVTQWLKLIALLRREHPIVAYLPVSQTTIGFFRDSFLILPAWLAGARCVLLLHGVTFSDWFDSRSFPMKTYVRRVLRRVSYMAVLGESLRGLFDGLIAPYRIAVVSNGIVWPAVRKLSHEPLKPRRYRILHLSTLSRLKGALVLLAAIPFVIKNRQDVEFIF